MTVKPNVQQLRVIGYASNQWAVDLMSAHFPDDNWLWLATGVSEKDAYKCAAARLRSLAEECEKRAGKELEK